MSRAAWYFLVDVLLLFPFLAMLATTAIVKFIFPPASQSEGYVLWGVGYDRWVDLMVISNAVFAVIILIHVVIHWNWVCGFVATRMSRLRGKNVAIDDGLKTIYGVGFLILMIVLLGVVVGAAEFAIQEPAG